MFVESSSVPYHAQPVISPKAVEHQAKANALKSHVELKIASDPYDFDGHTWAMCKQKDLCEMFKMSRRQITSILRHPPFQFDVKMEGGENVTLIRLGPKGEWTPRMAAKAMKRVWQAELKPFNANKAKMHEAKIKELEHDKPLYLQTKGDGGIAAFSFGVPIEVQHLKAKEELASIDKHLPTQKAKMEKAKADSLVMRKVSPKEFGCMVGLAQKWGPRSAARVLRFIMRNWSDFMVCHKLNLLEKAGDFDENGKQYQFRFFEFPSLSVLLKFAEVAVEVMFTKLQETKPEVALSLKKTNIKPMTVPQWHDYVEAITDALVGKLKDEKQ